MYIVIEMAVIIAIAMIMAPFPLDYLTSTFLESLISLSSRLTFSIRLSNSLTIIFSIGLPVNCSLVDVDGTVMNTPYDWYFFCHGDSHFTGPREGRGTNNYMYGWN